MKNLNINETNRTYYTEAELRDSDFFRLPQWLVLDPEFSKMSNDAKVLYAFLRNRFSLSIKNQWIDKRNDRVYVICKRESMASVLNVSYKTAIKIFNELVKYNLVEEIQNGLAKPNYIYILKPKSTSFNMPEFEEDNYVENDKDRDLKGRIIGDSNLTCKNYRSGYVNITGQDRQNLHTNNTNLNNTNNSNIVVVNEPEEFDKFVNAEIYQYASELNDYEKNILNEKLMPEYLFYETNKGNKIDILKIQRAISLLVFRYMLANPNNKAKATDAETLMFKCLFSNKFKNKEDDINCLLVGQYERIYRQAYDLLDEENTKHVISHEAYLIGIIENIIKEGEL